MRAPEFWHAAPGLWSGLLSPFAAIWSAAGRRRAAAARPYRAPVPVICVGNLVAGGSGKTPVVLSLAVLLRSRGVSAHIVSRGYGGATRGPLQVDRTRHDAAMVGDEPLLLAAAAPCWVSRHRAAGIRAAAAGGADLILMDDGYQNPTVAKDVSLLVVDAGYGFGNGRVIPAGPLREPIANGLARADAVILLGRGGPPAPLRPDRPVLQAVLAPVAAEPFVGMRCVAFAGIGRPAKFFDTLRAIGAEPLETIPFPDHHPFSIGEIARLRGAAERHQVRLVTTAKDWVRLPPSLREGILRLDVELRWDDPAMLDRVLNRALQQIDHHGRNPRAAACG